MPHFMGIDLGTSSVKVIIIDQTNQIIGQGAQEYRILIPRPGHAEQDPHDWWNATVNAARQAIHEAGVTTVAAIGLCGQMHGFAMLTKAGDTLDNAIIWPDQRSVHEVDEIMSIFGAPALANTTGTAPAAGFMAPTLVWLSKHEPEKLAQIDKVLTPKDYVRYRLCGEIQIDFSDASATALFDVYQHTWATSIIDRLSLPRHIFPPLVRSDRQVGMLNSAAAEALGLPVGVPIAAGCADQPAQAVGNGLLDPGRGSITIGTGGQVFIPLTTPRVDPALRLHTFCHAPDDRWYLLGASLSAGLSMRWLRDLLGLTTQPEAYDVLAKAAAGVEPGAEGLYFLPYLVGERAPLMDGRARGAFIGLTLKHDSAYLARAVMEGVAFGMRQIVDLMDSLGAPLQSAVVSGGGLANPLWRQIVADVTGRPLYLAKGSEKAGVGAAMLGAIAVGYYTGYKEACSALPAPTLVTEPNAHNVLLYKRFYEQFTSLYPLLKANFHASA